MKVLIILNDPPYGTERSYNGLRLARQLTQDDAVACAKDGQTTPNGYYNIGRMVRSVVRKGGDAGACGTCMDARGLTEEELLDGVHRSTMEELGAWTLEADKVVVF